MRIAISLRIRNIEKATSSFEVDTVLSARFAPYALRQTEPSPFALWEIFSAEVLWGSYDESEPSWGDQLAETLATFASWLAQQEHSYFDQLRANGFVIDLFCYYFLDEAILDVNLSPELLEQLGRLNIPVTIRTEGG